MATAKELRELGINDLQAKASELRESLFQLQLQRRTGSLQSPESRTAARRDLARVLMVLGEKNKAEQA
jgi:large subunit ribosomal protein L29